MQTDRLFGSLCERVQKGKSGETANLYSMVQSLHLLLFKRQITDQESKLYIYFVVVRTVLASMSEMGFSSKTWRVKFWGIGLRMVKRHRRM